MFNNESKPSKLQQKKELIRALKDQIENFPPLKEGFDNRIEKKIELHTTLAYNLAEFPEYYDESISQFIKAHDLLIQLDDNFKIAVIKGSIASIYYLKRDFANAVHTYKESLDLLKDKESLDLLKDSASIKEIMVGKKGLGLSLMGLNEEEKGVIYLLDVAELCVDLQDIDTYMEIISILKTYYTKKEEWELIIELEKKALKILKSTDNYYEIAISYMEIGLSYSKLKCYKKSLNFFKKSVNSALKSGSNNLIYSGIIMVAENYFHMREIENSKEEYLKALSLISYIGNNEEIQKTSLVISALGTSKEEINKAIEKGKKEIQNRSKN